MIHHMKSCQARFKTLMMKQGDVVMITATELSSDRISFADMEALGYLLGVAVTAWFLAAFILGDYRQAPS